MFDWALSDRSRAEDLLDVLAGLYWPSCQPPNKQLQRTVKDKVPRHIRQRAAAELRR